MAKKYNCTKNGIPYFRKTKTIGHKPDGSPIKKEFYGDGEKDCLRQIEEYMQMIKNGLPFDCQEITIENLMHRWLFEFLHVSNNFKSSSFERYEGIYRNYVKDSDIGSAKVYNIQTYTIQKYYNKLYKEEEKTSSQIENLNKLLRKFFNYCIDSNYITKNPCLERYIQIPGNADDYDEDDEENEITIFEDEDLGKILNNLNYCKTLHTAIFIASITGLRMGEILALKDKYLDLDNKTIKVRYTLSKTKIFETNEKTRWELKLQKPKTQSSIRTVNIPDNAIEILKEYKNYQKNKYLNNKLEFNSESLLFTTESCRKIDKGNFRRSWKRYLKSIDIEYKKFHALRHTFASLLFRQGATILEVKELLGHSDSRTTEKIYIYVYPKSKAETVNKLNYLIN